MTINELRAKRNQAWEAAKAFVETKRNSDGLLSDEDAKTYAQMEKKVQDYGAEIERMEAMSAMDAQLAKPTSTPITEKPMTGTSVTDQNPKTGRASDAYKDGMLKALRTNFRQVSNVLQEGIDADGGYLVPEEYDSRLIEALEEENIFRKLGHTITTSGERKINIAATKPAAAWIDEGEELTWGDAKFAQINLDAHKLHVAVKVTEELLYDNAFQLEKYILRQFAKALANAEEDAFLNGTGVGQPLGLLAEEGGAQIGVTAASATEITADELIDLVYSLKRPYRKNAKFICNDQTLAAIRKLTDKNGRYLWQDSVQAGEPGRLLGYEVHTSPYFPVITAGMPAIAFGDYNYYNIEPGTDKYTAIANSNIIKSLHTAFGLKEEEVLTDADLAAEAAKETTRLRDEAERLRKEMEEKRETAMRKAREDARRVLENARRESESILNDLKKMKKQGATPDNDAAALRRQLEKSIDNLSEGLVQKVDTVTAPPKTVKPGDRVDILTLGSQGTVLSAPNAKGEVELQAGIMKFKAHISQLRLVKEKAPQKKSSVRTQTGAMTRTVSMECDVRGMMLEEALSAVDQYLNEAIMAGLGEVQIIHGKGTGVLRSGIQQHLKRHMLVKEFRLGVYGEGESGVTVVTLK